MIKIKIYEGWIKRYIGEVLINVVNVNISESEHWFQKAIEILKECGADGWVSKYEKELALLS